MRLQRRLTWSEPLVSSSDGKNPGAIHNGGLGNGRPRGSLRSSSRGILRKLRPRQQGSSVFYPCKIQSLFEDLDLHGFAAEQAFELPNALLQPADLRCGDHILIHPHRFLAPSLINRLQRKTRLGESPWRRATKLIDMPGCSVSLTTKSFCSVVNRRRRATPVMTST